MCGTTATNRVKLTHSCQQLHAQVEIITQNSNQPLPERLLFICFCLMLCIGLRKILDIYKPKLRRSHGDLRV